MVAKRDISKIHSKSSSDESIKKGDTFESIAICHDNHIVAFKQTGAGSDCENVRESEIGDVDTAIKDIKDNTKKLTN